MNPRFLKEYGEELFRFIVNEESIKGEVYACSQNVPTIGVGYALAERSTGGAFTPRAGLENDLGKIGEALTTGDKARLLRLCEMLNNGTIRQAITGMRFKDSFDLRITDEQARQLFLLCVPTYDKVLRQKLGIKLYRELQNSREMVTLFSLAYNAPSLIGKGLVTALREGNRAKVQYEILYNSNKNRDTVLDSRRRREAKEFGRYDSDIPSAEELKAEKEIGTAHATQMAAYSGEMESKRKRRSAKKASGTRTALNKNRKRQQSGSLTNQREVRRRIDDVKADRSTRGHTIFERIMDTFGGHDKVTYREWNDEPLNVDERSYHSRWS